MDENTEIFDRRKLTKKELLIVCLGLLSIVAAVLYGTYTNISEIRNQVNQNLWDVAGQNAVILEQKVNEPYRLILSIREEFDEATEDNIEEKLRQLEPFLEEYRLKRFAFSFPDGTTYSTDGNVENLAYRDFFIKGMQGDPFITETLVDALRDEHSAVNVLTIPVTDASGNVKGVFGVAYDSWQLNETLDVECFDGLGHSYVTDGNGAIISTASGDDYELPCNILTDVLGTDDRNEQAVEEIRKAAEGKKAGSGILYLEEKNYYCMMPVKLLDDSVTWYIITTVPESVIESRVVPIQRNQYVNSGIIFSIVVIGALMIIAYIKKHHEEMIRMAYEDPVTKGMNYAKFCMQMEKRNDSNGYMVLMDIENFSNISLVAGKKTAEIMIQDSWKMISTMLGRDEMAAHITDDRFIMLLKDTDREEILSRIGELSRKISGKTHKFGVYGIQARFGIYEMSKKETMEKIYSKVNLAREYAIGRKEANFAFYQEVKRIKMQYEKQLEEDFPAALEKHEFEVWYQPKYGAQSSEIVGSEALVRWRKESGEMVSPGEFIPLFERNGMIVRLDEYMFAAVCRQQKEWIEQGREVLPVSVNVSRATLCSLDVHKRYSGIMKEYGISPEHIQIEVTETVMEQKLDLGELLNKFREMGVKVLMDDFGTGYSSLATLSLKCFDTLKLDKKLIDNIGDKDGEIVLYHIIHMGQQMGLHITAEGVERQKQLQFLKDMRCDDIQGFYFSRPLPKAEYEKLIDNADK